MGPCSSACWGGLGLGDRDTVIQRSDTPGRGTGLCRREQGPSHRGRDIGVLEDSQAFAGHRRVGRRRCHLERGVYHTAEPAELRASSATAAVTLVHICIEVSAAPVPLTSLGRPHCLCFQTPGAQCLATKHGGTHPAPQHSPRGWLWALYVFILLKEYPAVPILLRLFNKRPY